MRFSLSPLGYRSSQAGNLRWLAAVLGSSTDWLSWGVDVRLLGPAPTIDHLRQQVANREVLRDYEADSLLAWARRHGSEAGLLEVRPTMRDELRDVDLLLGFELPPAMKNLAASLGLRYISFHVHPLRFLADLCLGATTNDAELCAELEQQSLDAEATRQEARRWMALVQRNPQPALNVPEGWPLLIAQTPRDAILIEAGRFADWPDFEDRLGARLAPYPGCVLLEHPQRSDSSSVARYLRARFGKPVLMSNANGYGVLFQTSATPEAITMSSSLGVEALERGIPTTFLLGDPRNRLQVPGVDQGTTRPLHHGVLAAAFWRRIFGTPNSRKKKLPATSAPFAIGPDHLRSSLESWSYTQLRNGFLGMRARQVLYPSTDAAGDPAAALAPTEPGDALERLQAEPPLGARHVRAFSRGELQSSVGLEGFHPAEAWGAWTEGRNARVTIAVEPDWVAAGGTLLVRLRMDIFEGVRARAPVCRITHADRTLALVFFRPASPRPVDVHLALKARFAHCVIELSLTDAGTPYETMGTEDVRTLALAIHEVEVSTQASTSVEGNMPPAIWGITTQPYPLPQAVSA